MLNKLKNILKSQKIDYFIVPNNDEFCSEYLSESEKRIEFLTGFNGSNAVLVIKNNGKNAFFTDGRYSLQALQQLNKKEFEIFDLSKKSVLKYLVENVKKSEIVALDAKLHSKKQASLIKGHIEAKKAKFLSLTKNPIDEIWKNRPDLLNNEIFILKDKYSGEKTSSKINRILEKLDKNSDAILLNFAPSINWLLNIRSNDIEFTPLALCQALIFKNGKVDLFINENRLNEEVKKYFIKNKIKVIEPQNLENHLKKIKIKTIQIDPNYVNFALFEIFQKQKFNIIEKNDPILALKAIKNKMEIKNNILAHEKDGIALTKFLYWLSQNEKTDEILASKKLLEFRKLDKDFIYPSFETISGFGSNGAIIHYRVDKKSNKKFSKNNLYLVDSGGQYLSGTTDVTRTILIGNKPKKEHIENFTRVLKGHIAIARAKFPIGTKGSDLDVLARYHLWQNFKDYAHGTGHGVGQFLSVHESPPSISKNSNDAELKEGMVLSNEPGYYENNKYGIRIENLMLVEKSKNKNFLQFKTLTLAPIDPNLINFKMLTYPEKKWLREYHAEILKKFGKKLNEREKNWLKEICQNSSKN